MLIGHERVHVTKDVDDLGDRTADFGKEIELFPYALKMLATHPLHLGIELRLFLLPVLDVADTPDPIVNVGIVIRYKCVKGAAS